MSARSSVSPVGRRVQDRNPGQAVSGQGLARNPSLRSSRPVRKMPVRTSISGEQGKSDDDTTGANAQIIADLKQQVERAEQASENYRRQLDAMQKQLDEASNQTTSAEEREFQFRTQIDKLQAQLKDSVRQSRELELSYDSERKMLIQDQERQSDKEAQLHSVVNRLTESLKFKNQELASTNKMGKFEASSTQAYSVDRTGLESTPGDERASDDFLEVLQSKDNAIEGLRLELADIHLKMAEEEHMGDGRWRALEKEMVDTKMRNARLQEENESFQMLLSERTLKGDFMPEQPQDSKQISSLAEELESADGADISPDTYRMMEAENKTLRESNKALTLYIDKIIGRLLQHEGFEHIITDKDDPTESRLAVEKPLFEAPVSPRKVSAPAATAVETAQSVGASLLQRAKSVVARPAAPKQRPVSMMPSANENPTTAPSIPINRTHRRARSDQANDLGAANVIQQMNRGSQLRTTSGSPMSPGLSPMSPATTQRQSYFGPPARSTTTPAQRPESSSNSMVSEHSLEAADSTDASSARASVLSSTPVVPGAVMKQSQLRPLRLVQEKTLNEEEQKKANRGSWMGWFQKGSVEVNQQE